MTIKVFLSPSDTQVSASNGIGRVVLAQRKYLPAYGVQFVDKPDDADVRFVHAAAAPIDGVDIMGCHGLYFEDIPHQTYASWHYEANMRISRAARQAKIITVPSSWVAIPFQRDMRRNPWVIPHGIELDEWQRGENLGYALWNKGRRDDVCDPAPIYYLAEKGITSVSTYAPTLSPVLSTLIVTGALPADRMKLLIQSAGVYLATTLETFGIGTLEAMACGIPVLGYRWGGTADLVDHKIDGYLVDPGDLDGLLEGYYWIKAHEAELSENAIEKAKSYTWESAIGQYFEAIDAASKPDPSGVAVVIPCYNYGRWVGEAIQSVLDQAAPADEIIVVDDGSSDNSREVIKEFEAKGKIKAIFQENQGVAAARNNGILATSQPFIICLDADDMLHPAYIRICKPAMEADRSLGIVYTGLKIINADGQDGPGTSYPPEFDWNIQSRVSNPPSNTIHSGAMFRRDMWRLTGGYKQRYAPGEDTEFWTRGLSMGFDAKRVTDEKLFLYRGHAGSASRSKPYKPIDDDKPWMRDKIFPLAAPNKTPPKKILSYSLPLISVIIPVGPGHTGYLPAALESLLAQSFRFWEAIVIDDTMRLTKTGFETEFEENQLSLYPFVKLLGNASKKHGAGVARNIGIAASQAPLLFFLDADDYLQPETLEKTVQEFVKMNGERYIYTDWWLDTGKLEQKASAEFDQGMFSMQHPVTALVAREDALEVGGFDEDLPWAEDHDFYLKLIVNGRCGKRVPLPLMTYRARLGERRNSQKTPDGAAIPGLLRERYKDYFSGGKKMSPCCGGSSAAEILLKAKNSISGNGMYDERKAISVENLSDVVRVEYIGQNVGAISFMINGKIYRGGNNPVNRYADARKEDVEKLLLTGSWRMVAREVPPAAKQAAPKAKAEVLSESKLAELEEELEIISATKDEPIEEPVAAAPAAKPAAKKTTSRKRATK